MSKKASVMFTFTAIAAAIAILTFFIVIIAAEKHKLANGEDQLAALQTFNRGEFLKQYIDGSLKMSAYSSAFILGREGGSHQTLGEFAPIDAGCGSFNGVQLLNTNEKECYPEPALVRDSYKRLVAEHLNYYLSNYPDGNIFITPTDFSVTETSDSLTIKSSPSLKEVTLEIIKKSDETDKVEFLDRKWTFWPVEGPVTDCYGGPRSFDGSFHEGVDFSAAEGTQVKAVDGGKVYLTCSCVIGDSTCCGGLGNTIVVKHNDQLYSRYSHLSKINFKKDNEVKIGEIVGLSGNTGLSTGPHLHFSVYLDDRLYNKDDTTYQRNPFKFLPTKYNGFEEHCPLDSYGNP
ncbi:MAG: M23 family metallopeptidase [Nanoarchaeota archaeon]